MTDQHLDLLRSVARQATDQDIALSATVLIALLDEIAKLRKQVTTLLGELETLLGELEEEREIHNL